MVSVSDVGTSGLGNEQAGWASQGRVSLEIEAQLSDLIWHCRWRDETAGVSHSVRCYISSRLWMGLWTRGEGSPERTDIRWVPTASLTRSRIRVPRSTGLLDVIPRPKEVNRQPPTSAIIRIQCLAVSIILVEASGSVGLLQVGSGTPVRASWRLSHVTVRMLSTRAGAQSDLLHRAARWAEAQRGARRQREAVMAVVRRKAVAGESFQERLLVPQLNTRGARGRCGTRNGTVEVRWMGQNVTAAAAVPTRPFKLSRAKGCLGGATCTSTEASVTSTGTTFRYGWRTSLAAESKRGHRKRATWRGGGPVPVSSCQVIQLCWA